MKTNKIIDTLYDIATELDRESEFIRNKIEDYESLNLRHFADYWDRELNEADRLRLSVLEEIIPFILSIQEKGGDEE